MKRGITLLAVSGLFITCGALADGVREINQACVDVGCFAGDSPGFPVEIANPGAYRLSSNLETGPVDVIAIRVTGTDIDLDLNGFAVIGPNTCTDSGTSINCTFTSGANLVQIEGANNVIHDGAIRGAMGDGLSFLFGNALFAREVHVSQSGDVGINTGAAVKVTDCSAKFNHARGLWGNGSETRFDRNYVYRNGTEGIRSGSCQDNTSTGNYGADFICDVDLGGNSW